MVAETRTPAAATSFAIFAFSCFSGLTISTICSSEVLINSNIKTNPMVTTSIAHSTNDNFKINPKIIARIMKIK